MTACYIPSQDPFHMSGKRVVLFSYGSGLASAMYSIRVSTDCSPGSPLQSLVSNVKDIPSRLASRRVVPPAEFEAIMKLREETHHQAPYTPQGNSTDLFPATFYLTSVDNKHRRAYSQVPYEKARYPDPVVQTVTSGES